MLRKRTLCKSCYFTYNITLFFKQKICLHNLKCIINISKFKFIYLTICLLRFIQKLKRKNKVKLKTFTNC